MRPTIDIEILKGEARGCCLHVPPPGPKSPQGVGGDLGLGRRVGGEAEPHSLSWQHSLPRDPWAPPSSRKKPGLGRGPRSKVGCEDPGEGPGFLRSPK